jgi:hypothetical protein
MVAMEQHCVAVVFVFVSFDGFANDPRLLAETLEEDETVVDGEIILLDFEWVIRVK